MPSRLLHILGPKGLLALLLACWLGAPLSAAAAEDEDTVTLTIDEAASLLGLDSEASRAAQVSGSADAHAWILSDAPHSATTLGQVLAHIAASPSHIRQDTLEGFDDLTAGRFSAEAQLLVGLIVPFIAVALLLLLRAVRGRGDVVVELDYPAELRGSFLVGLVSKRSENGRGKIRTPEDALRAKSGAAAMQHHMVSRETHFRNVPAGTWYVAVDGYLQQQGSDEVVGTRFEEREITVERRGSGRLQFDLSPHACAVELKVVWDRRPVPEAQVARFNVPSSVRLAKGPVTYPLEQGRHVLIAGSADRVAEYSVDVDSFNPIAITIDLAERGHLLFSGCPPAVGPYLAGDISAAARALERDGQQAIASLLLARFHQEQGQMGSAAKHFEAAGREREAAELREALGEFERAAELYEKAGDDERAAEMFRSAGKLLRAGDAYSRVDAYDSAVACFKRAGDVARWVDALAKKGEMFEAASVALDQGDRSRAIQYLSEVGATHERYPEAMLRLAEAFRAEGHHDVAARKLEEVAATRGPAALTTPALDLLSQLYEKTGAHEQALLTLEKLRERDATFPNLATRIERIKQARSRSSSGTSPTLAGGFGEGSRYEILEELGRGGMGIVFKARDKRLGRIVALKRLPDNLRNHPKAVELFLREARAAAALNHTNIVTLFDADHEDGTYYITMELLEGNPLQRILRARKKLSANNVAKLGGQIATGLHYAHRGGVVHRDIKTANLFFTQDKVMKIMDFGLAKMQEEVRRATTVIGGTPYYMAPEQSAGASVDHRADLYALGVTFYELLTGAVPFKEGDVAYHHRHTAPPDPREKAEEIPDDLATLVLQCMEKLPEDRPADAHEVCTRLGDVARQG